MEDRMHPLHPSGCKARDNAEFMARFEERMIEEQIYLALKIIDDAKFEDTTFINDTFLLNLKAKVIEHAFSPGDDAEIAVEWALDDFELSWRWRTRGRDEIRCQKSPIIFNQLIVL